MWFGNIEKIICSILGNILKYPVHYILVEVSCMQFVCIKNETACENNFKKWPLKACGSLITQTLNLLAPGTKV